MNGAAAERDTLEEPFPVGQVRAVAKQRALLTDRDRDLLGLLVLARYLTTAQVYRLFFDGKRLALPYRRLNKLANPKGQPPLVAERVFHTYEGRRVQVWSATPNGLLAAHARVDPGELPELPKHAVGARFLSHAVQMNELLVELWRSGPGSRSWSRVRHPSFRWTPSDALRLAYDEWELKFNRQMARAILPDAMLELPRQRRRYFLECEMGTNTIVPESPDKPGATLNKAAQYQRYLLDGPNPASTHYSGQYPDRFKTEVLFLVLNDGRAKSVNSALAAWRAALPGEAPAAMRAVTFESAARELRALAGLPALASTRAGPTRVKRSAPSPQPSTASLTPDEVKLIWRYVYDSTASLKKAREMLRSLGRTDLPEHPGTHGTVVALVRRMASGGHEE